MLLLSVRVRKGKVVRDHFWLFRLVRLYAWILHL
jgi:hypothetical protein